MGGRNNEYLIVFGEKVIMYLTLTELGIKSPLHLYYMYILCTYFSNQIPLFNWCQVK